MKFFLTLLTLTSCLTYAQRTTSLEVIETEAVIDKVRTINVLSTDVSDSNLTTTIRGDKKRFSVTVFDEKYNKVITKAVKRESKEYFKESFIKGNNLHFFSVHSPKKKIKRIYSYTFNLESNVLKKTLFIEYNLPGVNLLSGTIKKRKTFFEISKNEKFFAIAFGTHKKLSNSYTIKVFDSESLELIYEREYHEFEKRRFVPNDVIVDNKGDVYLLGKLYFSAKLPFSGRDEKKLLSNDANYEFIVNKVSKSKTEHIKIGLENEHIGSLKIVDKEKNILILGLFSEKEISKLKGSCSFILNKTPLEIISKKHKNLPKKVYEDLFREGRIKRIKKRELPRFFIDHIVEDSKGNSYLLAEKFYVIEPNYNVAPGGMSSTRAPVYHYDDIVILKFDSSGDVIWGRSILKKATKPTYNAFIKNDNLHVLFNSSENLTKHKDGRVKASEKIFASYSLFDYEYSTDGDVQRNKVEDKTLYNAYYGALKQNRFIMRKNGGYKNLMILK